MGAKRFRTRTCPVPRSGLFCAKEHRNCDTLQVAYKPGELRLESSANFNHTSFLAADWAAELRVGRGALNIEATIVARAWWRTCVRNSDVGL